MGIRVSFEVHSFKAVRLIGNQVIVDKKNPVPELWNKMLNDGTNEFLQSMPERYLQLVTQLDVWASTIPKPKSILILQVCLPSQILLFPMGFLIVTFPIA